MTMLSCSLRLPLLDLSSLLSQSLPLPLDEAVLMDAKQDKMVQQQNMHTVYKYQPSE